MVLIYGHDEVLLATRQRILEQIGIPVSLATTALDFRAKLCTAKPILILFCQSLSAEECSGAEGFVKEHSPGSRILLMFNGPGKCNLHQEHAEFFCLDGPAALVKTVKGMIPDAIGQINHSGVTWKQS